MTERHFHFTKGAFEQMIKMRVQVDRYASPEGLKRFHEGLDYVRTFSGGGEEDWETVISQDLPVSDTMLIATIFRIRDGERSHYMTIGMLWDYGGLNWSFHS